MSTALAKGNSAAALAAKKRIVKEVEKETASLIISGIEKVLRENLTPAEQEAYIRKSLTNLPTVK